ncbi:RNase P modulator RnpM [Lachnoclostridium sp. Marseille-P6806]|uniref:RNase P modulator RnpM n=1 Tax=Lachnoclostridium sp. Marseille-P6806 TaxID=2364793 RepID=UPI001030F255|nr:YlxR family protein [Lachnoclostridium sp. Marseille-P6806]
MQQKKIPMRSCIGCGRNRPKKELVRIVRTPEGEIVPDGTGRAPGRGAYLCSDPECLDRAIRRKALGRAFETEVPPEAAERLKGSFEAILPRADSGRSRGTEAPDAG